MYELDTLPAGLKVMRDLGIPHSFPVAGLVIVDCFGSGPITGEGNAQPFFESMLTSEWLFNVAEAYFHEAAFAPRAWLLTSATASAAEKH